MPSNTDILFHIVFLAGALPISIIDLRTLRIPNVIVYPLFATLLVLTVLLRPNNLTGTLLTSVTMALLLFLVRISTKGLGFGDIKLGACIGLYCGYQSILPALLLAASSGILVAGLLLAFKKIDYKTPIPFAPFLAFGALAGRFLEPWVLSLL